MIESEEGMTIEDLEKEAFKVDLLPKNFKQMGVFQMGGYFFMHIRNKKCLLISLEEGEDLELLKA